MKKILVLLALVLASFGVSAPAQASGGSYQEYCNSTYSGEDIKVGSYTLGPRKCLTLSDGFKVHNTGASYKVKYDGGSWSTCRSNNDFDAYDKPDKITFLTYEYSKCRHYI